MVDRDVNNDHEQAVTRENDQQPNNDKNGKSGERHSRSNGLEQQQQQESLRQPELQHPLEKPYELENREVPLNPKQGDVLHPPKSAVQTAQQNQSKFARNDKNVVEIFRPQVSTSWAGPIRITDSASSDPPPRNDTLESSRQSQDQVVVVERITAIEPAGSEDYLDDPPSKKKASEKGSLLLAPLPEEKDRRKADPSSQASRKRSTGKRSDPIQERPSPPETKRILVGFGKTTTTNNKSRDIDDGGNQDDDEHLSDVPSDVDSVTRDRYLLAQGSVFTACHLLKNAMVQKEKVLEPLEREFLLTLLHDYENEMDETSVINEDQISAVEQATLRLENDPLFFKPGDDENHVIVEAHDDQENHVSTPSAIATAARHLRESILNARRRLPDDATDSEVPAKRTIPFLANPCNKISPGDVGTPADILLLIRDEDDQDDNDYFGDSKELNDGSQIVRFDGWSNQKSAEYPFLILGADNDSELNPRVLTPSIMEALRGFFPFSVSESNFWLKFSLVRDGASLSTLLYSVRSSTHTIIGVETKDGEVFGSFTGAPWRKGKRWFGTGEAFLWRLKKPRYTAARNAGISNFENEMEVYPYTGYDDMVQYCTSKTIAVGGGDWTGNTCPFENEPRGIGFMIDCDLVGGETNSCATFANPRLCRKTSASNEFAISNLEVWTLTP
eukprot:CAMPEP_0170310950 /NCGR_PEP_ID=MMETSP0116_2-20130129/55970_1 /TAXON_ID=400756 /ORGANISM="Durinskia baltica, Strain CSIRO CS-38" /LENGTH=672 /DNA_ID=CAMNT_0010563243 /DNA_START=189 /DNA_END=2205 /DNA_ORIENTATION=-